MNHTDLDFETSVNRFWLTEERVYAGTPRRVFYDAMTSYHKVDESYVKNWAEVNGHSYQEIVRKGRLQETPNPLWIPNAPPVTKCNIYAVENQWRQSKIQPDTMNLEEALKRANPFVEFLTLGFGDHWEWALNWFSYRYQNPKPTKKPHSALYIYSTIHGTGKSTLAAILEEVFGSTNVKKVSGGESVTAKGSVANWTRALLIAEEVSPQLGSILYQTIKSYTGQDSVEQDAKHKAYSTWEIPAQLVMISNHAPTFFEPSDRRFAVFNFDGLANWIKDNNFYDWLKNDGPTAIASLFKCWDVDEFSVWEVPMTTEKEDALRMSALDLTVERIKEVLANNPERIVFEVHELLGLDKDKKLANQYKHKLNAAGLISIGQHRYKGERPSLWVRKSSTDAEWQSELHKCAKPDDDL